VSSCCSFRIIGSHHPVLLSFCITPLLHPRSTLFPYTTLFRSIRNLRGRKKDGDLTSKDAVIVGLAQAVAVTPGISRSGASISDRSEEHTSELQSRFDLVCRLLLEKKNH